MSKSSLNLSRTSSSHRKSTSLSLERSQDASGFINDLLNIEMVDILRGSTEFRMKEDDNDITDDVLDEAYKNKLKLVGNHIGRTVVERLFQGRGPFENDLEVIKLLCKDIWTYLYGKQLDNLRTNHKGTYVLYDNQYRPIANASSFDENAGKILSIYISTQLGIIQGCLMAFNLPSIVSCDMSALPQCTFQIKLNKDIP